MRVTEQLVSLPLDFAGDLRPAVAFLDHAGWCDEPHEWIREYFRKRGFELVQPPAPPWMAPGFDSSAVPPGSSFELELDMRSIIHPTVMRMKGLGGMAEPPAVLADRLLPHVLAYWAELKQLLVEKRPQFLVVLGGYWVEMRLALLLARRMGTRALAMEISYLRERFILEEWTGQCGNRHSYSSWMWHGVRDRPLDDEMRASLDGFLSARQEGSSHRGEMKQPKKVVGDEVRQHLDIPRGAPIALVFGQVYYDSVVSADFGRFESLFDMLVTAVEAFAPLSEWHVVVRCHPKETRETGDLTARRLREHHFSHNRVRIVAGQELNTYSIMDAASFGIAGTSQAGLEMLTHGKPVIVCGECFYAGKGFTMDVGDPVLVPAAVTAMAAAPHLSSREVEKRDRFLYGLIFEYFCPREKTAVFSRLDRLLRSLSSFGSPGSRIVRGWRQMKLLPVRVRWRMRHGRRSRCAE